MRLSLIGLDFDTAPVDVREKLSFQCEQLQEALNELKQIAGIAGGIILSTCNRVEIYISQDGKEGVPNIKKFLGRFHGLSLEEFEGELFVKRDAEVVKHLFSVASSVMSMVVGENQIQGQIKTALDAALESKAADPLLLALFQHALKVGKRVRNETQINEHSLSISHSAVSLLQQELGSLAEKHVCVVGLGKMSMLAVKVLHKQGVKKLTVVNRTLSKVKALEQTYSLQAKDFNELESSLVSADAVITSTAAPGYLITPEVLAPVLQKRRGKMLTIIDIAVPRDVDPDIEQLGGVKLLNIDELKKSIEVNKRKRAAELNKAAAIIAEEVAEYEMKEKSRGIKPVIRDLRNHAEGIREQELQRALRRLSGKLTDSESEILNELTRRIVNKMLHTPIVRLREAASADETEYEETVRELFDLRSVA